MRPRSLSLFPAVLLCSLSLCAIGVSSLRAEHTFEVFGTGINGTAASAVFTTDDPQTAPGYVGDSTVFTSVTLSLTNIPQGPGSFTLTKADGVGVSQYNVTNSGTVLVAPAADYPGTGSYVYRLGGYDGDGVNSPLRSYLNYADYANNTLTTVDIITWSPAQDITGVPEPATTAAGALSAGALLISFFRRRSREATK